jgi:ComF family protein
VFGTLPAKVGKMARRSNIGKAAGYCILQSLKVAADIILPRVCVICGERLLRYERHICLHSLADLPLTHFWEMRSNQMADRFNALIQQRLEKTWNHIEHNSLSKPHERYTYAAALFFYKHEAPYRHILYNLKYEGRVDVGKFFGSMLGEKLAASTVFRDVDCVIPVPLHWLRRWRRGYNQAEIIAHEVATALGTRTECGILYRKRITKTQTKLDIKEKATNVEGAFKVCHSSSLPNNIKHILLVDDTFTTGSTLMACFTALREVFPPSVRISIATLAFVGEGFCEIY